MSTPPEPIPCRLAVILARRAPVGVIFRRGPSKLVELIKWNTDTDTFERGQWFKGRIYEHCSDLSPDGSLLVYFAAKLQLGSLSDEDRFPAWTAISRPPWLTALALWRARGVSYLGGGLFLDDSTLWLSPYREDPGPHKGSTPGWLKIVDDHYRHISTCRLIREGWAESQGPHSIEWAKKDASHPWTVIASYSRLPGDSDRPDYCDYDYSLVNHSLGLRLPLEAATWADWDHRGRLVFAREGKLFAGEFNDEGQMTPRELADFNADAFEPRQAPAWAREW